MPLVVIGGVAAGLSAAARARRIDPRLEIIVLEKGPVISYGACGLPYFVEGRVKEASQLIVYTPEYFRKERNIDVRTGARVVAISHPRREVQLEDGARIRYDRLVIATGARCDVSGIAGFQLPHVFTLHTIEDAERMRRFLREKQPRRAVVVGAGYIGVEAADAIRRHGVQVTDSGAVGREALLRDDPQFTAAVQKQLELHGVELRLGYAGEKHRRPGTPIWSCSPQGSSRTSNSPPKPAWNSAAPAPSAPTTGWRPTSAASMPPGDCAEITHLVTGRPTYIPLGTTANKAGRVAGANAAGGRERFPASSAPPSSASSEALSRPPASPRRRPAREGFDPVAARIEANAKPALFRGHARPPSSWLPTARPAG